jgi:hypothetical protein
MSSSCSCIRHSRAGGNPVSLKVRERRWVPAFAGTTK